MGVIGVKLTKGVVRALGWRGRGRGNMGVGLDLRREVKGICMGEEGGGRAGVRGLWLWGRGRRRSR